MKIRIIGSALMLAGAQGAFAAPLFLEPQVNEQLKLVDVAGVHFGDTAEQVQATLQSSGWKLDTTMHVESFGDIVGKKVSARTGRPFRASGKKVPAIQDWKKGSENLQVTYAQHALGSLVFKVGYHHPGVTTRQALEEFERRASAKYAATPLVRISGELFCLPADQMCERSVANGGVISELPSVRLLDLHGANVILEGGEAAEKIIAGLPDQVAEKAGPLDTSF